MPSAAASPLRPRSWSAARRERRYAGLPGACDENSEGTVAPCHAADELQDDSMLSPGTCVGGYTRPHDRTSAGLAIRRAPGLDMSMRWLPGNDARLHSQPTEISAVPQCRRQ